MNKQSIVLLVVVAGLVVAGCSKKKEPKKEEGAAATAAKPVAAGEAVATRQSAAAEAEASLKRLQAEADGKMFEIGVPATAKVAEGYVIIPETCSPLARFELFPLDGFSSDKEKMIEKVFGQSGAEGDVVQAGFRGDLFEMETRVADEHEGTQSASVVAVRKSAKGAVACVAVLEASDGSAVDWDKETAIAATHCATVGVGAAVGGVSAPSIDAVGEPGKVKMAAKLPQGAEGDSGFYEIEEACGPQLRYTILHWNPEESFPASKEAAVGVVGEGREVMRAEYENDRFLLIEGNDLGDQVDISINVVRPGPNGVYTCRAEIEAEGQAGVKEMTDAAISACDGVKLL